MMPCACPFCRAKQICAPPLQSRVLPWCRPAHVIDQAPSFLELGQEIGRLAAPMHKAQVLHDVGMQGLKNWASVANDGGTRHCRGWRTQLERSTGPFFVVVAECAHR